MKIIHISDLHIGLKLHNRDMKDDQAFILGQIAGIAAEEKPDAILIAGDIYDKAVPSADAAELFDGFVTGLSEGTPDAEIMMISGNHDSGVRIDTFRKILEHHKIHMIGTPPQRPDEFIEKVTLFDEYGEVNFYLLPFVRPSMIRMITGADDNGTGLSYNEALHRLMEREQIDTSVRNVIVSHQFYIPSGTRGDDIERMGSERVTVGNIDAVFSDVLEPFDYAALGHIHKPMCVGSEYCRYSGTPLACSVSEAGQEKSVIVIEMKEKRPAGGQGDKTQSLNDGKENMSDRNISIKKIRLKPLHEVREIKGTAVEVLMQACDDFVSLTLTDKDDIDVIDIQDRLRAAFPNLLEIKREGIRTAVYDADIHEEVLHDPLELCEAFLGELDENEKGILGDVINKVKGVNR